MRKLTQGLESLLITANNDTQEIFLTTQSCSERPKEVSFRNLEQWVGVTVWYHVVGRKVSTER